MSVAPFTELDRFKMMYLDEHSHELTPFMRRLLHNRVHDLRGMTIEDINEKHSNGMSPLHWAIQFNCVEACEWLIQNGVRLEEKHNKQSPLDYLVCSFGTFAESKQKKLQIFRLLLENGAVTTGSYNHGIFGHCDTLDIIQKTPELRQVFEETDQIADRVYAHIPGESRLTRLVGQYLGRTPSAAWKQSRSDASAGPPPKQRRTVDSPDNPA